METNAGRKYAGALNAVRLFFVVLLFSVLHPYDAHALTINVVGPNNEAVADYRWLVEEDATKPSNPGLLADGSNLSLNFHTSYMPVLAAGNNTDPAKSPGALVLDPLKRYYVSVLPGSGYQMGGAAIAPGQDTVTIVVNALPIPTAQISVFVFEDNQPINGKPDLPQELGLAGFSIILKEAGGTFGQSGGAVTQDAFANPLGTTYQQDANGDFVYNTPGDPSSGPVVQTLGSGFIASAADGVAHIKYLFPAKYTIEVVPPAGSDWHQTSTIEGTRGIDAWVKANEPSFFQEFGPAGHHVDMGFVRTINNTRLMNGASTITGRVVNMHTSRPPDFTFFNGDPVPNCWVGLNIGGVGGAGGNGAYTAKCNADSTFSIPGAPPGIHQLVVWDDFMDRIIATAAVNVPADGSTVDLLDVPVFDWFGHYEARVFFDTNKNGFRDPGEVGMQDQALNLRFRDGSIYQSITTNPQGEAKFTEVFPFFSWLIAEVDFARFKATGATVVVDAGGDVPPHDGWTTPSWDKLNPQPQFETDPLTGAPTATPLIGPAGNNLSRTETGPVLLEGIQTFLGQTNVIEWGKALYGPGENGGVSGIVHYGITRAEVDPRYAAAENWEPGIPRVQVALYKDCNNDGVPDKPDCTPTSGLNARNADGTTTALLADVDNYPFCWRDAEFVNDHPDLCPTGVQKGTEDYARSGDGVTYSYGDAFVWGDPAEPTIGVSKTDSWDDSLPSGCQLDVTGLPFVSNGYTTDCFDGLRNFNQVRPAVFDGGYAFGSAAGQPELPPGTYVVEAVTPPGYLHQGSGDMNVVFGDSVVPSPLLLPPECVGDALPVPQFLNLFTNVQEPNPAYDPANPGKTWKQCDRKKVDVAQAKNAAADFYMFTEVPVSGHITGFILDDTSNEFDPNAPTFGEKHAPTWLPVSLRDWSGREISRVYGDQWGNYNALVPSTFTINPPFPSGVSPNMVTACMNHPGPIQDTRAGSPTFGQMIIDPYFNRQYSQFCYTFQYLPGKTTYLDTPVMPVAAFTGPGQFPLDCEFQDGTPVIYSVVGSTARGVSQNGPYVPVPPINEANQPRLTIVSQGTVDVPNPAYDGTTATPQTIKRDFGFGATQGDGYVSLNGTDLPVISWSDGIIVVRVPNGATTGQLMVTRDHGNDNLKTSVTGVTVTVGGYGPAAPNTIRVVAPGSKIQTAIDAAIPGDMIMVPPGTYDEFVIMNKKVRLQGWGAPSTVINAAKVPAEKLQLWRNKIDQLLAAGSFDLLPGQGIGFNAPNNEPDLFNTEEAPGIMVLAKASGAEAFNNSRNARIDGFTITGADTGGAIFVNGYARFLDISNNKLIGNSGWFGGGIRIGHPNLINPDVNAVNDNQYGGYVNALNNNIDIHHNHITQNGAVNEGGGGVTLCTGSHNYVVTRNYICGNFTGGNGGGIAHMGRSNNGEISHNTVVFNQSFNQGLSVSGGGIYIGGSASLVPLAPRPSAGTGNVLVDSNLVQSNMAGAGDGGGIRAEYVNGLDVRRAPNNPAGWYKLTLWNNMVVDNIAGLAGGGISLQDVVLGNISNNTVANNDSTATAGMAFTLGNPNQSNPQPAGIVSRAHTTLLFNTIGNSSGYKRRYSDPTLLNNIVWQNRSFYWMIDNSVVPATFQLYPDLAAGEAVVYSDLAVLGTPAQGTWPDYTDGDKLNPRYSLLTSTAGYGASNISGNPQFVAEYFLGDQSQTIQMPELTTSIATAPAFDEGGNFIDVHFGPLSLYRQCATPAICPLYGDYHLKGGSPAIQSGLGVPLVTPLRDFDTDLRENPPDIGADQLR